MSDTFSDAEQKFLLRRDYAQQEPAKAGSRALLSIETMASALSQVDIGEILPDDSRQTFAVGIYQGNRLIVANKGVTNGETYAETVAKEMANRIGGYIAIEYTASVEAGLHAEMAIVQHVLKESGNPKGDAWFLKYVLQIFCVGKPVCPDCAGWMNKHGIPHLSLNSNDDKIEIQYACGKPSQGGQWRHPRTGAFFQSENPKNPKLNTYQKGGKSHNRPLGS